MDARIIDFLAFIMRTDRSLRQNAMKSIPINTNTATPDDKKKISEVRKANVEMQNKAIREIEEKAEEYGLKSIAGTAWAENLLRQGIIERPPHPNRHLASRPVFSFGGRDAAQALAQLKGQVEDMERNAQRKSSTPGHLFAKGSIGPQIQLEMQLTSFGRRLADACGLLESK